MPIGYLWWGIYVLWIILCIVWNRGEFAKGNYQPFGGSLILFILLFIIGWKLFGFVIQG